MTAIIRKLTILPLNCLFLWPYHVPIWRKVSTLLLTTNSARKFDYVDNKWNWAWCFCIRSNKEILFYRWCYALYYITTVLFVTTEVILCRLMKHITCKQDGRKLVWWRRSCCKLKVVVLWPVSRIQLLRIKRPFSYFLFVYHKVFPVFLPLLQPPVSLVPPVRKHHHARSNSFTQKTPHMSYWEYMHGDSHSRRYFIAWLSIRLPRPCFLQNKSKLIFLFSWVWQPVCESVPALGWTAVSIF